MSLMIKETVEKTLSRSPVLRLIVAPDVGAAKFLYQDANDADEQNEVNLEEKNKRHQTLNVPDVKTDACEAEEEDAAENTWEYFGPRCQKLC